MKKMAYGGVVFDEHGKILLRKPTGEYGGYVWTFPKGRPDEGECPEDAALREVMEECGVEARIVGRVPGSFKGDTTDNIFYLMVPVRTGLPFDNETEEVRWGTVEEARKLISETINTRGRKRDLAVLNASLDFLLREGLQDLGAGQIVTKQDEHELTGEIQEHMIVDKIDASENPNKYVPLMNRWMMPDLVQDCTVLSNGTLLILDTETGDCRKIKPGEDGYDRGLAERLAKALGINLPDVQIYDSIDRSFPKFTWEDVEPILKTFTITADKSEMRWFQRAWTGLEKGGLTQSKDEIERHWVLLRAVTLGVIYNEFAYYAWDQCFDFRSLVDILYDSENEYRISPALIARLVGDDLDVEDESEIPPDFDEIIFDLASKCRKPIYDALLREFGDDSELFLSLWVSPDPPPMYLKTGELPKKIMEEASKRQSALEYIFLGMQGIF